MEYKPKVLIVDDREENLIALEEVLGDLDVDLVKASSGNEAVARTIRGDYALILMDVQMPGMDGFEAARLMRKNQNAQQTPIIFVTAINKEQSHVFEGYDSGAVDYLFKPLDHDILLGKVKVFLELARHREELRQALSRLEILHHQNQSMLDCSAEGILGMDNRGIITFANPSALLMLKEREESLVGRKLRELLAPGMEHGGARTDEDADLCAKIKSGKGVREDNAVFFRLDGNSFPVEYSCAPLRDEKGRVCGGVMMFQDVTKRKQTEEQLLKLANFDLLTGLANRSLFSDFEQKALARARRNKEELAVLFLDLDRFKTINDTMGHDIGDLLLKSVAGRLANCVRESDLVARLGGDEFGIVLEKCGPEGAASVAKKIQEAFEAPHRLDSHEIFSSTSIGIAIYPHAGAKPEEINKAADTAMYFAKKEGRNNYQFFAPEMQRQAMERLRLENELRCSLKDDAFQVYYQPQIDISSGRVVSMEALLRWHHKDIGPVPPSKFIPVAEETGLITVLGEWVLRKSCATLADWLSIGKFLRTLRVSINVSIRQLKLKAFWKIVETALRDTNIDPRYLEIELTETSVMEEPETAIHVLKEIRQLGVRIAIDDFGTGYSSLGYLQRLPVDTVKIDLSFVKDIGRNKNNEAIIKAIIALARSLELQVVAEGVETEEQADFLRMHECYHMQGFYFCKPLAADTITELLVQSKNNFLHFELLHDKILN